MSQTESPDNHISYSEAEIQRVYQTGYTIMGELPEYGMLRPLIHYQEQPLIDKEAESITFPHLYTGTSNMWCFERADYLAHRMKKEGYPHTYTVSGIHKKLFPRLKEVRFLDTHVWVVVSPVELFSAKQVQAQERVQNSVEQNRLPLLDPSLYTVEQMTPESDYTESRLFHLDATRSPRHHRQPLGVDAPLMPVENGIVQLTMHLHEGQPVGTLTWRMRSGEEKLIARCAQYGMTFSGPVHMLKQIPPRVFETVSRMVRRTVVHGSVTN